MSVPNDASGSSSSNHNFALLNICSKVTLDGTNYNDWMRNIKMALRFEDKEYVLDKELIEIDEERATPEELAAYKKHYMDATKVACIMVATMTPELQKFYEDYWPYEMNKDLMEKYHKRARQEKSEFYNGFWRLQFADQLGSYFGTNSYWTYPSGRLLD
ncbi:hypothetical protein E3N88_30445 [Mikania micrantha]|uniref:Retrotransposon Copia-like N-terminal domain-containing protein n=1 Tax=Mikania micrantha TaxID=192012 RepID=A0A5N6MLL8_9ASTR|nr:hypothetical protein E3N88_30445 [Mikania micrantha]